MPTPSSTEKNAPKRARKGAGRAKTLITAAAFVTTVGGWAVCAASEKVPGDANGQTYASAEVPAPSELAVSVRRVDGLSEAPAPVAVTRSSR
jgi:hypothetical protein